MTKIRVIAGVVDTTKLTLYKENGTTVEIMQGDHRLERIVNDITPGLTSVGFADVDISEENHYKNFEEKSSGVVKFFRMAKKAINHLFNDDEPKEVAPAVLGSVPVKEEVKAPAPTPAAQKVQTAVKEIISKATPAKAPEFTKPMEADETIVAVMKNEKGEEKIIPDAHKLKDQITHANKLGSTKAVEAFMARLLPIIDKRGHSVEDLMKFMERGDLPIAEDGCIVAYKRLKATSVSGVYVDCHSGNVKQRVGSYVNVDEKYVDPSRRNECSQGLHIARRGYLGTFHGDIMVICKIPPENVIAVPSYDANKVRVMGYHIVGLIPQSVHSQLINNRSMTDNSEAGKLLAAVIAGKHIARIEDVKIGGPRGTNVVITSLLRHDEAKHSEATAKEETKKVAPAKSLDQVAAAVVDPKATAEKVRESKKTPPAPKTNTQKVEETVKASKKVAAPKKAPAKKKATSVKGPTNPLRDPKVKTKVVTPKNTPPRITGKKATIAVIDEVSERTLPKMKGNRQEIAKQLWDKAVSGDKASWGHLWLHKKQSKQGWEKLGFDKKQIERINTNKPDWV